MIFNISAEEGMLTLIYEKLSANEIFLSFFKKYLKYRKTGTSLCANVFLSHGGTALEHGKIS